LSDLDVSSHFSYDTVIHTSLEEESILEAVGDYVFMTWEGKYYLVKYIGTDTVIVLPEKYKNRWKELIAQYKQEREFYKGASARILVDAEDTTVIEYADKAFSKCVIQIFTQAVHYSSLSVYPTVDENATYVSSSDGQILSGKEIMEDGIKITPANYSGSSIVLTKRENTSNIRTKRIITPKAVRGMWSKLTA
jgi:hypothetical protein